MLEVAYLFEESKGKTAQEISPNKRHGTLEGGVKYGPGKFGTGLIYDGTDDNLTVKGYRGVGGSNARTVLYWFKSASARDHAWVKWGRSEQTKKSYVRGHLDGAKCYLRVEITEQTLMSAMVTGIIMRWFFPPVQKMYRIIKSTWMAN